MHYEIAEVARGRSSKRLSDRGANFGCPPASVSPAVWAVGTAGTMGTNYGVGHIGGGGGEIIGPDDRAWGFRGVAITAHRSLASGRKVRDPAPGSILRGLITVTADPVAPHPRDHRCDHQNDDKRNADHAKRGSQ